jgi:hypothetical protein
LATKKNVSRDPSFADVGTMWAMTRAGSFARCALFSSGSAWELRMIVDGTTLHAEHCVSASGLFSLADEWKARLSGRGWTRAEPRRTDDRANA